MSNFNEIIEKYKADLKSMGITFDVLRSSEDALKRKIAFQELKDNLIEPTKKEVRDYILNKYYKWVMTEYYKESDRGSCV